MDRNLLLGILPENEKRVLAPFLTLVEIKPHQKLETSHQSDKHVYFLRRGVCEARIRVATRGSAAVGLIGYEGIIGSCHVYGLQKNNYMIEGLVEASALRIEHGDLMRLLPSLPLLTSALLRYLHVWTLQIMYTAFANAEGNINERLARWLLMLHDRTEGDFIGVTHQAIASGLNVRRPGVTSALQLLVERSILKGSRGGVTVLNRQKLVDASGSLYGTPESEYRRTLRAA